MTAWWQPLVGVFVGWLLGQATEVGRQYVLKRRYRKAIYAEILNIQVLIKFRIKDIQDFIRTYQIQKGVDLPIRISNRIFTTRLADVLLYFTERERFLLIYIHDSVDAINGYFATIRQYSDVYLGTENAIADNLREILLATAEAYIDARKVEVLIEILMANGDVRNPKSIERLDRISSEAAKDVRVLRGKI